MFLDDVVVPAGALLGREGSGFGPMQTRLATRRLEIAGWCINSDATDAVLPNPEQKLRAGMFVQVEVELPGSRPQVVVPATAVSYASYGNSIFVFESAGLCIAHLSHLHHLLEPADIDTLGRIDIVMVPVDGIWTMSQIPEPAPLELWDCFPEFESKIRIAPTTLSVVTGFPGHGKSHLFQQVWFNIARNYGIKVAIFSAETRLKPFIQEALAAL